MLQAIRDRATGWIAWAIVILIAIVFAAFGINDYFTPSGDVAVATVDGEPIDYRELQSAMSQQRARLQQMLGTSVDDDFIRGAALDGLIDQRVLLRTAVEGGMRVGDDQIIGAVQGQQAFADENGFSQARYENILASQGMTPQGYEQSLRTDLMVGQLRQAVQATAVIPPEERRAAAERRLQTRTVRTLRFAVDNEAAIELSDDDVAAYYEANKAEFRSPPLVSFEYVELDREAISEGIVIDEAVLERAYDRDKGGFTKPEQRSVRHILIETADDADDAAVEVAREKVQAIRAEIDAGAAFEDVAKEKSEDIGSAAEGGALGVVERGVFDPAFDKVAFAAELNALSEPVKTPFGWHLILVDEIRPETVRSFDDMRADLEQSARQDEVDSIFYEQLDRLSNLGFENPESLEPAATQLGLEIHKSGFVSRDGADAENQPTEGMVADPGVLRAAFEDVRETGTVSDVVEVTDKGVLMLRVLERRDAADRPLADVRDEVEAALAAQRRFESVQAAGLEALAALRAGGDTTEVATAADVEWSEERDLTRRDAELSAGVVEAVFAMPAPSGDAGDEGGVAVYDGIEDGKAAFVVVALSKIDTSAVDALEDDSTGAEGRMLARLLSRSIGAAELEAFAVSLREAADVSIVDEDEIDLAPQHNY